MSGVFEKQPLVDPNHRLGADTRARAYRYFYCPKCKARHKYGHRKSYIDCWRCWRTFSPDEDSYRYEDDRLTNLTDAQRDEAEKNIYGMPYDQYLVKLKIRQDKARATIKWKVEQRERDLALLRKANTWHYKLFSKLRQLLTFK